ncbi:MAG TPA: hypothetical protein VK488_01675 [Gaiellaceae bacterium]|nr:hypothetical protein [Gaiellaceae bacterium]
MGAPGFADDPPQALLARTLHIARLLLAEQPVQVDSMIAGSTVDLPGDPATDRFVMAVVSGASTSYWVAEHGTVTTRHELPDWAEEADVHVLALLDVQGVALEQLKDTASRLRDRGPELYEGLRVRETVDAAEQYYGLSDSSALHGIFQPIQIPVGQLESLLASAEAARGWVESAMKEVRQEFTFWRLPFEPTFDALATLVLLLQVDDPRLAISAGVLRTVRPDLGPGDVHVLARDATKVREQIAAFPITLGQLGPPLAPGFYALELELSNSGGLEAARDAMRSLELTADRQLDSTRRQSSLERFYLGLADAALHYRAADAICAFLIDLYASTDADTGELRSRRVIYEERRVTIVGSFFHASGLGGKLDPTSMPSIGPWIDALSTLPAGQARALVHDHALQLVIPDFMRDLVLGSVWRLTGQAEAALAALERAYERLNTDRSLNAMLPWEPNFLVPLCRELAQVHESLGHDRLAATMRERATAELRGTR